MQRPYLIFGVALVLATSAASHPLPKSADPKPNAVLTASPAQIQIGFSEGLVGAFSGIELDDASGKQVPIGAAVVDPNNSKLLAAPVSTKLAPGSYTVKWHVVGDDTHHVSGHYTFEVKS
jgi:methionine-rich copper-binding protein CopC